MSETKVALAMIAKDKSQIIEKVLNSTKGVFDFYALQDTGSSDNTVELFTKWCKKNNKPYAFSEKHLGVDYKFVEIDGKKILADFGKARNDSFGLIPEEYKDYGYWVDTDDEIYKSEQIPALASWAKKNGVDVVITPYKYAQVSENIDAVSQERERLINLKKKGQWQNRVHENYKFLEPANIAFTRDAGLEIMVLHKRSGEDALATGRRNHLIMKEQLDELGIEGVDEEFLQHMAFDHFEHREYDECIVLYKELEKRQLSRLSHPQELLQTCLRLARSYFGKNDLDNAIAYAVKTIEKDVNYPDGYLILSEIYMTKGLIDQAEFNADKVLQIGRPNTVNPVSDIDYLIMPRRIKLQAFVNRGQLKEAIGVLEELIQIMPGNDTFVNEFQGLQREVRRINVIKAIGELALWYQETNQSASLDKLIDAIPLEFKDDETVRAKIKEIKHDYKRKSIKIKFSGPKSIVIFAGAHFESWNGRSDTEKGIGGSEGMCIQMARELASIGNKVFVYNECGTEELIDGVQYLHYSKWDAATECDVFISLRAPQVFSKLIKAKKQFLWLHDTHYGKQQLVDLYAPNKILVLSEYHQEIIMKGYGIKDKSIFHQTRNSLNKTALEYIDANPVERDPFQVIYASSYDRGLEYVLQSWPKVKEAVPQAKLKIFYGWNTYDGMMQIRMQQDQRTGMHMQQYRSNIIDMISKLPDVYELGRVSQNELYKEFAKSGVWYYPTDFTEISCITAMQAQALGAFPVCTPVAALSETVSSKFGVKVDKDKIADALIYQLLNQDEAKRTKMMDWAREKYDVVSLAKEWNTLFDTI